MTRNEATALADRIMRTWKGSISIDIWAEVLEEMHHGAAETAWKTLRDTSEHQPSIAQFRGAYNAQLGTAHEPRIDCEVCGGDGWETVPEVHNGHAYEAVKPCRCRAGDNVRDVHRRIRALNDAELDRLGLRGDTPGTPRPTDIGRRKETA